MGKEAVGRLFGMSLRSLGSLSRGSMRVWSCSSSPGIAVEGGLGLKAWVQGDRFRSLRKFYYHADGHNSPVAAATLPSFVGSRPLHSRAAACTGSSGGGGGGGGGGVVLAGGGVLLAAAAFTTLAAYIFLRPPEDEDKNLPDHVDWSEMGAVTAVKDQGNCGNCWAHATVGAIEGCYKLETGKLVELSVQQLTDCACEGCKRGWLLGAFWYSLSGVTTATSYPQRKDLWYGPCCSEGMIPEVKISRFSITSGTEESLMRAVAKQPVAVLLDDHKTLQTYTGGIITYDMWPTVDKPQYRHAALVVGYGTDEFGVKFWKLKNSHGPNWGEGGYFRIQRGVPTKYGVAGIRKGFGVYPHMSWFGKKATKGSSVKIAEEVSKVSSVEIAEEVAKGSAVKIAEGVAKGSAVKIAGGVAKGSAVKMKTADEGGSIGGTK